MDLVSRRHLIHVSQLEAISPTTSSSSSSIFHPHMHHSSTSFPIIAIAIIGIIATAILLVSYYIFVIKCCLNWHRIDLLRRFSPSRRNQDPSQILLQNTQQQQPRGLDEAMIRLIPIIQFKPEEQGNRDFCECAVCLNEFQQDEKLRIIPNCSHVFHIDCIDVWLQNNANCPLCRTSISLTSRYHIDQLLNLRPSTSSSNSNQDQSIQDQQIIGGDEDFVVIELSNVNLNERGNVAMELPKCPLEKKRRKLHKVTSMGDEYINIRGNTKDDPFAVQPIRRSISMDSSGDRQFYLAVQEALQQQKREEVNCIEGCSSGSGRVKKSFFSFGYGSRSRSSVQPLSLDP